MDQGSNMHTNLVGLGFEIEYAALRSEILKRMQLRQQFTAITLTIAGVFLGLGVSITTAPIVLIFPLLIPFLALGWAQNDLRIKDMAIYIREHIERFIPTLGWEIYLEEERGKRRSRGWRYIVMAHGGVFLVTQVTAILIGSLRLSFGPLEWSLLGIDLLALLAVVWILIQAKR